jgi:hypothetical protein
VTWNSGDDREGEGGREEEVMDRHKTAGESDYDEEEGSSIYKIKLSELRSHLGNLGTFINSSSDPEVQPHYSHLRAFREIIVRKHQTSKTQHKLDAFFMPISRPKPVSPQPSTSSANGVSFLPGLTNMEEEQLSFF